MRRRLSHPLVLSMGRVLGPSRREILTVLAFVIFLFSSPRARADQVRPLIRGADSLLTFVSTIDQARKSLDLTTFIFGPCDSSGQVVMDAMKNAVRRGVRVRVLLDAYIFDEQTLQNLASDLTRSGVQLRIYNNSFKLSLAFNPRTHVKLMVADGETYIAGGRNLSDEYFGLNEGLNFLDQDVWVHGASARAASAGFDELWGSRLASVPAPIGAPVSWAMFCERHDAGRFWPVKKTVRALEPRGASDVGVVRDCAKVSYVQDSPAFFGAPSAPGSDEVANVPYLSGERLVLKRATGAYAKFIGDTRARLEVLNWSYVPVGVVRDAFARLRERKIPVQVLTNRDPEEDGLNEEAVAFLSAASAERDGVGSQSVVRLSGRGSMNDRNRLTPRSATFRIHAKMAIRDRRDVLVGSFNLDPRSTETNLENLVIVRDCPALAKDLHERLQDIRRFYIADVERKIVAEDDESGTLTKVYSWIVYNFL